MEQYNITQIDMHTHFFHFTKEKNLDKIADNGLMPKIGYNARYIEKNPKVFFVHGLDNMLILFDCWINVWEKLPRIPLVYTLGAWLLRYKWFPNFISNTYFATVNKYKHKKKAFKVFDKMLKDSVLLNLNLKENIDFKWDDTDEIKVRGYRKEHLITMGYSPNYSDVNSTSMDEWNMHTLKNHGITADKIKLCSIHNSIRFIDIFYFVLEQTEIDLKTTCPCLYEYLCSRNIKYKNN